MASIEKKELFRSIYLEALPKKPITGTQTPGQPTPQKTEDGDKIKQQAQPIINALNKSAEEQEDELEDFGDHFGAVEQYENTDLPQFNYKSLKLYLNFAYGSKQPLLIYGDPGIGKSQVVQAESNNIAESLGRKYIYWNRAPLNVKLDAIQNPEKYFVNLDIRVNGLSPEDFVGIPDIASKLPYLETKQYVWIYYMSLENSAGILFLDELNQGSEDTLKKLYEVVLDKTTGGTPMSEDWVTIGAGNLGREYEQPIPRALISRFTSGVLVTNPEEWLEWAEQVQLDRRIIAFVRSDPANNFYTKPKNPDDPFPNPRSMHFLSDHMKFLYKEYAKAARERKTLPVPIYKAVADKATGLCGAFWARKFLTFLKHIKAFDFKGLAKDPSKLSKYDADKLNALTVFITGKMRQATNNMLKTPNYMTQPNPNDAEILEGAAKITDALSGEYKSILWNMIRRDVPKENFEVAMSFLVKGNYDVKTREQWNKKTFPNLVEFLEYEEKQ